MRLEFNGKEIVRNIRPLGFWQKMVGLAENIPGDAVYFRTRFGIHTFGLARPIDVLVLDNNGKLGAVFCELAPGQIRFWNPKFQHVFELPAGTLGEVSDTREVKFVWYYN